MDQITSPLKSVRCYVSLGSNLGDRQENIARAIELLGGTQGINLIKLSSFEETDPIGPSQPKYLNAVAAIETVLSPLGLLDRLQTIEGQIGRVRNERWGPRIIDLDLLFYGDERIQHPRLTVPHPEIANRPFVQRELREAGYCA
jgi:2-amino-4-hydroxy-6-hydroxymethyldihydropteridine diphosphokinase